MVSYFFSYFVNRIKIIMILVVHARLRKCNNQIQTDFRYIRLKVKWKWIEFDEMEENNELNFIAFRTEVALRIQNKI